MTTRPKGRPHSPSVKVANIPAELKARPQWLNWFWNWNGEKWRKKNIGSWGDRATWLSFDQAIRKSKCLVGFIFSKDDDYAGIDLDGCRNPATGELSEFARKVLASCPTYAEVSPSQTGLKLFMRGTWCDEVGELRPGFNGEIDGHRVEIYDRGRWFTVTGQMLEGYTTIIDGQDLLHRFAAKVNRAKQAKNATTQKPTNGQSQIFVMADDRQHLMDRCQKYLEKMPDAVSGQGGHNETFHAACECFRFGLTDSEAITVMNWYNSTKCKPPWTDKELAHKLESARGKVGEAGEFGCRDKDTTNTLRPQRWIATSSDDAKEAPRAPRPSVTPESMTEVANALRIIDDHGHNIRWCDPWLRWLVWDGRRWKADDCCLVERMAKRTMERLFDAIGQIAKDSPKEAVSRYISFVKSSNSANGIRHALELAHSEVPILPDQLNKDPWLLNVQNGTIDLRTNTFREHRRDDYITVIAPVDYNIDATAPTFSAFLRRIFQTSTGEPDDELIRYVKRCVGMSLTGVVRDHVLLFCHGKGANGKTTLMGVLQALLGDDYSLAARQEMLMVSPHEHPTLQMDLFGKRLAACEEIDDGQRLAEALVKRLTGGSKIRGRRMREDAWEFEPTHKVWLCANHKPVIRGRDYAIWRRVKLIPFVQTISDQEMDKGLPEKLRAELPGILLWALSGCEDWRAVGLQDVQAVTDATAEYRDEMDPLADFIAECCDIGDGYEVGATALWKAYLAYCEEHKEKPVWRNRFGESMQRDGITKTKTQTVVYHGVRLRNTSQEFSRL